MELLKIRLESIEDAQFISLSLGSNKLRILALDIREITSDNGLFLLINITHCFQFHVKSSVFWMAFHSEARLQYSP